MAEELPDAVFLGGDLLPMHGAAWDHGTTSGGDFLKDLLIAGLSGLRRDLGSDYPSVFVILGNDDPRFEEEAVLEADGQGVWRYVSNRHAELGRFTIYGYACVPPTPFLLKDWERYDVSRFVDPGAVSPEEGRRSVALDERDVRYGTILQDLDGMAEGEDMGRAVFLFHSPPYRTKLDRAALDGRMVDHAPLDVHVGSIAIRRFIEERQPAITLHGHVHESARITGDWRDRIGGTYLFGAAHDGPELAVVRFEPENPENATRELL